MALEWTGREKYLNKSPPPDLYHYTDQNGLLGIMDSGNLWATKVQYLNDSKEFNLAVDMAKGKLNGRRTSAGVGVGQEIE
jgi:hypothetical protein